MQPANIAAGRATKKYGSALLCCGQITIRLTVLFFSNALKNNLMAVNIANLEEPARTPSLHPSSARQATVPRQILANVMKFYVCTPAEYKLWVKGLHVLEGAELHRAEGDMRNLHHKLVKDLT